jgi:hypothetical protein
LRTAAAAAAAHLSGKEDEASFSRHLQAIRSVSSCLPVVEDDIMQASTGINPLLMKIDAARSETPAVKK